MIPVPKMNDDLPEFPEANDWWYEQPRAIRHFQEENKLLSALAGEDFSPVPGKPGMERNSKGQLRFIPDMKLLGPRYGGVVKKDERAYNFQRGEPLHKQFRVGDLIQAPSGLAHLIHWNDPRRYKYSSADPSHANYIYIAGDPDFCDWGWIEENNPPAKGISGPFKVRIPDAEGWIPHTPGDPMPCAPSMEIHCQWRKETKGAAMQVKAPARSYNWEDTNSQGIIAWKPAL